METLTDVVYPIGTGSGWNNNELRFSLRSLEKYGKNIGKIFVVGEKPGFLSDEVIHIAARDTYNPKVNADGNIINKVLEACADSSLSEDFLFINDDHLLLKPVDLKEIPNFHKGDMNSFDEKYWKLNYWRGRLKRTMEELNRQGLSTFHFDCHTPIRFNKKLFPEIISRFNYAEGAGLTMKSLYGNCVYSTNCKLLEGEKVTVFSNYSRQQLEQRLSACGYFSFNDSGLNQELKKWLYDHFPEPSRWETGQLQDRYIEIVRWAEGGKDYREGVKLFEKYFREVNLIKLFKNNENDYLRKKLEYKLIHSLSESWKTSEKK